MTRLPAVACLLIALAACSRGPVRATDCSIIPGPKEHPRLRATLVNLTGSHVEQIGVLVSGVHEFEFKIPIAPHARVIGAVGIAYEPNLSLTQMPAHDVSSSECWARIASFTDAPPWSVSPL